VKSRPEDSAVRIPACIAACNRSLPPPHRPRTGPGRHLRPRPDRHGREQLVKSIETKTGGRATFSRDPDPLSVASDSTRWSAGSDDACKPVSHPIDNVW